MIAACHPDADDGDGRSTMLRSCWQSADGRRAMALCTQPTMNWLENLLGLTPLKRTMAAIVVLFCDGFPGAAAKRFARVTEGPPASSSACPRPALVLRAARTAPT